MTSQTSQTTQTTQTSQTSETSRPRRTSRTSPATTSFTDVYVEVQQFYAQQVRHLDSNNAAEFAATFTEDGVFDHAPDAPPLRGRAAIEAEMDAYHRRRYAADPAQRRHWFTMLAVFPQPDGTIVTEYYALVLVTRPGERVPVAAPSCFVTDVLLPCDGRLLTRERKVMPDYVV